MIQKLKSRTEWQAFLISVVSMFLNRFLEWGLTEGDVYALFIGSGSYGVSRGVAKLFRSKIIGLAGVQEVSAAKEESEGENAG